MKRFLGTSMLAAMLIAGLGAIAIASKKVVSDPVGDASPPLTDIVKAKATHGKCGKLRHILTVAEGDKATRSLAQLEILAGGNLHLIRVLDRKAQVKQHGDRTVFTFKPGLIGNPARYKWAATIGSNDTSPNEFDRVPDEGYVNHRLYPGKRFRGYRSLFEGGKAESRKAVQGEFHGFTFRDRLGGRSKYRLILKGPGGAKKVERGRTNCRGKDTKNLSLYVNDVGGPGKWVAKWRKGGKQVAKYRFTLAPEFEG